jgi:hypothetical protein
MDKPEKPLMEFSVVETPNGLMFCFKNKDGMGNTYTLMASDLIPLSDFDFISLHITSTNGEVREYHAIGNHYDQTVIFTPKEHDWFAKGAVPQLRADMFASGDVILVSVPDRYVPQRGFAEKLWLLMTTWRGAGTHIINWQCVRNQLIEMK